jgi:hypothetical protein
MTITLWDIATEDPALGIQQGAVDRFMAAYPNIKRWLDTFKAGPNYAKVYETFTGFCASTKGQPWQAIT